MKTSRTPAAIVLLSVLIGAARAGDPSPFESEAVLTPDHPIDRLVLGDLKKRDITPARVCCDAVFVRRIHLDAIGTLPTVDEVKAFLVDENPNKRAALIDHLLERKEFVDYWTLKWCDLLRVKGTPPINLWPNAAQAYHRWIYTCVRDNMPYDRFARELLLASGSNFRVPQSNFYRAMQNREPSSIAQAVALTLMGERAEKWPNERLAGMASLFSQVNYKPTGEWKEEIVFCDRDKPDLPVAAVFPDGIRVALPPDEDWRKLYADWLITPQNPWFARTVVNRVWAWLLGRGIVHEPDDIRPDNPPSNPELLALLERELVQAKYDLRHLYRLILNSQTYQLSSIARSDKPEAAAHFARYPVRQLEAEVLIDALNQLSGTTEKYSSGVPEPYTFIPDDHRAIALPDGTLTSSFLEIFGRSPRGTGMESERSNQPAGSQQLYLLNSTHVRQKLQRIPNLLSKEKDVVAAAYLAILSRPPTEDEIKIVEKHAESYKALDKLPPKGAKKALPAKLPPEVLADLVWALVNSEEFLYRH